MNKDMLLSQIELSLRKRIMLEQDEEINKHIGLIRARCAENCHRNIEQMKVDLLLITYSRGSLLL